MEIIFDSEREKDDLCKVLGYGNKCPSHFDFDESCSIDCITCWKRALHNMKVKDKDYRTEAEKMISSGSVIKSEFFDILADELAKQLEEDDNKKVVKQYGCFSAQGSQNYRYS